MIVYMYVSEKLDPSRSMNDLIESAGGGDECHSRPRHSAGPESFS